MIVPKLSNAAGMYCLKIRKRLLIFSKKSKVTEIDFVKTIACPVFCGNKVFGNRAIKFSIYR